jgi:ribonuclease BN (tRNA processing enzyme)
MEIVFAGVGEAFDEHLPNTSILICSENAKKKRQILLDCGFTAAHSFWRVSPSPMDLDAVWISHFHGDHFFGLPLLLLRYWEEDRQQALTIIGQAEIENKVWEAMELAYPGFGAKIQFPLEFEAVSPGKDLALWDFQFTFALNDHSRPCLSVRIDHEKCSVFYSGDGRPTDQTLILARRCDLIIHESFAVEEAIASHGTVDLCIDFARRAEAKALALVHMNRDVRNSRSKEVQKKLSEIADFHAFLPEPGDRYNLLAGKQAGRSAP